MSSLSFDAFFSAATGHAPFDYQRRLATGDDLRPRGSLLISVPTGLGKTAAVILAWLWNRVVDSDQAKRNVWPRRLVYCLPMRTLVEQTSDNVTLWLENLAKLFPYTELQWLKEYSPVILMGGVDNEQKKKDWDSWPEKPCILIGTQDMLLSRALNRGYALSRYRWPIHFGLLNNDCMWVMDEVQLMGPGLWTSGQLDWMRQDRFGTALPVWSWWMSATNSDGFLDTPDRGALRPGRFPFDEKGMPRRLLEAQRPCEFWVLPNATSPNKIRGTKTSRQTVGHYDEFAAALAAAVVENHQPGTLSLVVCNTVRTAQAVHAGIKAFERESAGLILLTSRFRRGDRQVHAKTLIEFEKNRMLGSAAKSPGLICVATQVVEAGVDISSCRLWTEIAPWPSLVQRLGRLNRDGRDNQKARAFFFEVPPETKQGARQTRLGPYTTDAVNMGKSLAGKLVEIGHQHPELSAWEAFGALRQDENIAMTMKAALEPLPQPFPRAVDVHGLFSTEPDVFGGFTDVSQFVRGEDPNADVIVFWREFDADKPVRTEALVGPVFDPAEGCAVPIHRFREFLEYQSSGFVWDEKTDAWKKQRASDLCPGMVVMLPRRLGGYDVAKGWTGLPMHQLVTAPQPGPFEEEFRADPFTELGEWVALRDHLDDVRREAHRIVTDLQLPDLVCQAVVTAAEHHDIGKALEQWQNALPSPAPVPGQTWAKAPFLFAVRSINGSLDVTAVEAVLTAAGNRFSRGIARPGSWLADCYLWNTSKRVRDRAERRWLSEIRRLPGVKVAWMVPFRPAVRHEAASALALWHKYFRQRLGFPGLAIYLTAAHHGKVRTVLTARTKEGGDVCGISNDNVILPWSGGVPLDFSCASDGGEGEFSSDGTVFTCYSPGWTALIVDLLGSWQRRPEKPTLIALRDRSEPAHLGPFVLAYLETLIRCADVQASQNPSRASDV